MSAASLTLYIITWSFVALTPGPAVMCVASQAAKYGWRAACLGVLGIQMGNITFFVCIAFGLAALLATATHALTFLQFAGAGYLLYLGVRMISSSFRVGSKNPSESSRLPPSRRNLVLQAFAIQVMNPKALLFVSALLPQFLNQNGNMSFQLSVLMICTIAVDAVVLVSCAFLVGRGVKSFRSWELSRSIERVFGAALVGFGINLLARRR
jgi:homoserine/homoserine lactone efflux protein